MKTQDFLSLIEIYSGLSHISFLKAFNEDRQLGLMKKKVKETCRYIIIFEAV